ncbi:hypothetical protein SODALDRAFT_332426 [Sodiomyces alkalinus F11]|uniref:Alpha and gamma adaptin binding protein p34 n=1 Tax=Sodiomyces alkalinus (strain CBS 110278 / VKM F-3762 / F11) TaxID=1314773 RepID=A0A3N2PWW9_SODAK|nr:hypothetical protein SODALDRAFT_332426 [Sodiomyces alkalinus F11]ROT38984.1 hypothetical protein SODALDRAFT_332426 [Sodiomyces alkalinus F11]
MHPHHRHTTDLTGSHPEPTSSTSAGPSLAGTTHPLHLKTAYYTATVPVWLDLIPDEDPADWASAFLAPEAKEVLDVLGGIAVVFPISPPALPATDSTTASRTEQNDEQEDRSSSTHRLLRQVGRVVREGLGGWQWDGVGLAIGVAGGGTGTDLDHEKIAATWEEVCAEAGLELVLIRGHESDQGRNEFGEKMGIPRVLEALESNDWAQGPSAEDMEDMEDEPGETSARATKTKPGHGGGDNDDDDEFDPESLDFGFDKADFQGLKKAIWGLESEDDHENHPPGGSHRDIASPLVREPPAAAAATSSTKDEETVGAKTGDATKANKEDERPEETVVDEAREVENIEAMMRKLQAVRDMSAGLPEDQKRRMAAKAVAEVMKEL